MSTKKRAPLGSPSSVLRCLVYGVNVKFFIISAMEMSTSADWVWKPSGGCNLFMCDSSYVMNMIGTMSVIRIEHHARKITEKWNMLKLKFS
jgi:hypothetical protein